MSLLDDKVNTVCVQDTDSYKALLNGGWNKRRLINKDSICKDNRNRNVVIKEYEVSEFGTYRVEVSILAGSKGFFDLTLFAGRRNMIARNIDIKASSKYHKVFYQAVFPYIPALTAKRLNDKKIYISVAGIDEADADGALKVKITKEDVPVIWVAGDSTLTDQNAGIPYYPYASCAGWAQTISRYVRNAAVCNLSHSGMTSNCFRDDGHYDICCEYMKKGDLFVIQFGHNDQKRRNLAAFGGYTDNLKRYVNEVRKKGAEPVICSPISRIPLKLSEEESRQLGMPMHYSLLQAHADAAKEVARNLNVRFVDLHKFSMDRWILFGDKAKDYFMPGDITHTNEYGAVMIADFFMSEVRDMIDEEMIENTAFSPDLDVKEIPKEIPGPGIFDIEPPYLDIKDNPYYEGIRKAFRYALLDPCVMYLHPDDCMPRGQLLMVMFNAFRMAGIRPYKKKFPDVQVDEWISGYVQALIENDLIDYRTYSSEKRDGSESETIYYFRPDDPLTYEELSQFLVLKLEHDKRECYTKRACELGLIDIDLNDKDKEISRAEVYTILTRYMDKVKLADESLPPDAEVHPVH